MQGRKSEDNNKRLLVLGGCVSMTGRQLLIYDKHSSLYQAHLFRTIYNEGVSDEGMIRQNWEINGYSEMAVKSSG